MGLLAIAHAAEPVPVPSGEFAAISDRIGEARVVGVWVHPEFERLRLEAASGGQMVAEIVRSDGVHHGQCEGGGRVLFPRPELVEGPLGAIDLTPLCARLEAGSAATWAGRAATILLSLGAAVATLGGAWRLRANPTLVVGTFLVALAVRVGFTEPTLFDGGGAGYEKLALGMGLTHASAWGPGFALWMRPAVVLLGSRPEAVFWTNLGFASLWPALIAAIAGREGGVRLGWAAGLAAAVLPTHAALSWSEAMHVSAVTWGTLAVYAAGEFRVDRTWLSACLSATAAVAAVATRADLVVVAPVVVAYAWARGGRRAYLAWGAALIAICALGLGGSGAAALAPGGGWDLAALGGAFLPRFGEPGPSSGFFLAAHAGFTPALWWAIAVVGLAGPGGRRAAFWGAAAALPFVFKVAPLPDAVRLQAFAQGGFVILVALGVIRLRLGGWAILVLGAITGPTLGGPRWAHREEWSFLAREVPKLARGERVALPPGLPKAEAFVAVMNTLGPATWGNEGNLVYRAAGSGPVGGEAAVEGALVGLNVDATEANAPFEVGFFRAGPPIASVAQPRPDRGEADYDGDGRIDHYTLTHDGGSGADFTHLTLTLGDGRVLTAESGGAFGVRTDLVPAAVGWRTPELLQNLAWMLHGRMVFSELDPHRPRSWVPAPETQVHPAVAWVWDSLVLPPSPPSPGVLRGGAWTPTWTEGPPTSPAFTLALVDQPAALRAAGAAEAEIGLLSIAPTGLESLEPSVRCGDRQMYVAAHGVAVHDVVAHRSAWLWVSGVPGVSEAMKLRWPSISAVTCVPGDLVQVELALAEPRRVVISPDVARWVEVSSTETADVAVVSAALRPQVADLDGDALPDPISWLFTGGAHCCHQPVVQLSASEPVMLPIHLDSVVRSGEIHEHGTCGEGFEERPVDRCFVGQIGGRTALLFRETYAGRDVAPSDLAHQSAWRGFTFPENGGFVEADWGSATPRE